MVIAFENFPFGDQRQKGCDIADFLGCPILCFFLHAREVPGPKESPDMLFILALPPRELYISICISALFSVHSSSQLEM